MKVVTQSRYGGPDVLEIREVARPVPGENQVLVRVAAFGVTLADCAFRKADPLLTRLINGLLRPRNLVLGSDIGGEIAAVGSAVTRFKVGDAVFGSVGPKLGGAAEYVCLPESAAIVVRPAALDAGDAAGLSYAYLTAMPFLHDEARIKPGDRVLINGAASSVGLIAVQLAKHFGAEVTAVCSARNGTLVRSLGADRLIDRASEDFTQARDCYDVIFDAVGKSSFSRSKAALRPGGVYLTTVPSLGILMQMLIGRNASKRARIAFTGLRPDADQLADMAVLVEMIDAGVLKAVTDRRYPLAQVADAHAYVEAGQKAGNVVVELD